MVNGSVSAQGNTGTTSTSHHGPASSSNDPSPTASDWTSGASGRANGQNNARAKALARLRLSSEFYRRADLQLSLIALVTVG